MTPKSGSLATATDRTEEFWRSAFDANGKLITERTGQLWDAIIAEHGLGHRGEGRCIAIIDGHFDLSWIPQEQVHPASKIRTRRTHETRTPHGTIVALLALTAAPLATVLLIDAVTSDGVPREDLVAAAIDHAAAKGADIINLSLQLPTDCALRDSRWMDPSLAGVVDPDPDAFLRQTSLWIEHAEPYSQARCPSECMVCDALARVPTTTLVVTAAGNNTPAACPACFRGAVGVGFHRTVESVIGGTVLLERLPSETEGEHSRRLLYEVTVEEPPGFEGTSFASPMVSGLAALMERPGSVAELARLSFAVAPLAAQSRLLLESNPSSIPDRAGQTLRRGLVELMAAIPEDHRHWNIGTTVVPCPICSTVLTEWYNALAVLAGRMAIPEAFSVALVATAVAPISAAAAGNLAAVWLHHAAGQVGAERVESLGLAEQSYTVAILLAGNAQVEQFYTQQRHAVRALLDAV